MRHQPKFGRASAVYAFATENLGGYYPELELGKRSVLTVCGSGDHVLNAILYGAASVTAFDINQAALAWARFKATALKTLEFEEFRLFFLKDSLSDPGPNREALNYEVFSRFKGCLDAETEVFFETLYTAFDHDGLALRNSAFFNNRYDTNVLKLRNNPYLLSPLDYEKLRSRIEEVPTEYRDWSVLELAEKASGREYDVIVLSNLCDYAVDMFDPAKDPYRSYIHGLCAQMLNVLAPDGVICAAYLYTYPDQDSRAPHSDLDIEPKRRAMLEESVFKYREFSFRGVSETHEDMVVLLSRKLYESKA